LAHRIECKDTMHQWMQKNSRNLDQIANRGQCEFVPIYDTKTSYPFHGVERDMRFDSRMGDDSKTTYREFYLAKFSRPPRRQACDQATQDECLALVKQMSGRVDMIRSVNRQGEVVHLLPALCRPSDLPEEVRQALPQICGLKPTQRIKETSALGMW
ncbi:hypothetical protein KIPB_007567, partial [Kipferlia bialata]